MSGRRQISRASRAARQQSAQSEWRGLWADARARDRGDRAHPRRCWAVPAAREDRGEDPQGVASQSSPRALRPSAVVAARCRANVFNKTAVSRRPRPTGASRLNPIRNRGSRWVGARIARLRPASRFRGSVGGCGKPPTLVVRARQSRPRPAFPETDHVVARGVANRLVCVARRPAGRRRRVVVPSRPRRIRRGRRFGRRRRRVGREARRRRDRPRPPPLGRDPHGRRRRRPPRVRRPPRRPPRPPRRVPWRDRGSRRRSGRRRRRRRRPRRGRRLGVHHRRRARRGARRVRARAFLGPDPMVRRRGAPQTSRDGSRARTRVFPPGRARRRRRLRARRVLHRSILAPLRGRRRATPPRTPPEGHHRRVRRVQHQTTPFPTLRSRPPRRRRRGEIHPPRRRRRRRKIRRARAHRRVGSIGGIRRRVRPRGTRAHRRFVVSEG